MWIGRSVLMVGALVLAACSPGSGVTSTQAMESTGDAPSVTNPPGVTFAPDAEGLPSLSTPDPDTTTGTLDNGLRYLIRENDNPGGKVELRLVVDVGAGLEDDDQVGGAHFLEHMLFNGTERFPKNELIAVLRSFGAGFGADINASTSRDQTVYQLSVPNDDDIVDTGLDVLEQWLSFATISPDDVEDERGIILDEWRSRSQSANGRVFDQLADFYLAGSMYDGHSPIGGRDAIESITADDLRRFYDDWYRPDNAAVIVVGDVDVARIERELVDRFAGATSRGTNPERVDIAVDLPDEDRVRIVGDPDLAEGFVGVALPASTRDSGSLEADSQWRTLERLAFEMIATRLDNDALRGDAPYDRASVDSSSIVRSLSAPEISVSLDGEELSAATQAIVDEFERVERFGFTQAELDRAVASRRSSAQRAFDGSDSRQDVSYASEYVRHVLEGEWYVTAQQEFDFVNEVLDRASVETVGHVFVERYAASAMVFAAFPDDEIDDAATPDDLLAVFDAAPDRQLEQRDAGAAAVESLMERPDPAAVTDRYVLADQPAFVALDPVVIEFANGVTVSLNPTTIVENQVYLEARSPGGLVQVADDDVADAQAVRSVISQSGVGEIDRVALDEFLDDKSVVVTPFVDPFLDGVRGEAATPDLEVMLQLINRLMTAPRVDQIAIDRYIDDELPFAEDPGIDQGYAGFDALLDTRYGDEARFVLPTVDSLATVNAAGIERIMAERFGNAGDWTFAFSGDFDVEDMIELTGAYLGTLPGGGVDDPLDFSEPAPPAGPVTTTVRAGQGETANVAFLFTASASDERSDDVLALVVREVIGNRLTDFIREELGDSYSPFARIDLGGGPNPATELYISVSTADDLVENVSAAVLGQLDDLRTNGPSGIEFDNAITSVAERLGFINNVQINDEILDVLVDSAGSASFDDFVTQSDLVAGITEIDVRDALDAWTSADDYIEIRVRPRT